jgi:hypothetical protein
MIGSARVPGPRPNDTGNAVDDFSQSLIVGILRHSAIWVCPNDWLVIAVDLCMVNAQMLRKLAIRHAQAFRVRSDNCRCR